MKLTKKKVLALALAVCLLAILSFSTLAWFSDDDSVTNKFQMADSTQNPDNIFSVDVKEKVDTDGDGEPDVVVDEGNVVDGGNTYTDILPGSFLYKEPIVANTGAYDQYVRVRVTVDNANAWQNMLQKHGITDLMDIFEGYSEDYWTRYDEPSIEEDKITYVFYLDNILQAEDNGSYNEQTLFTGLTIPTALTQYDMAKLFEGQFKMEIVAEAVQSDNLGVDNAYDAFTKVLNDQPLLDPNP